MCRALYPWLLLFPVFLPAQVTLYSENFDGVSPPGLPGGWTATSPEIFTSMASVSQGYEGASGGNNLVARNCVPTGEWRSFMLEGLSSEGASGLVLTFGHRRTSSFTVPVTLQWSANGINWIPIAYSAPAVPGQWSLFTSPVLPPNANDQAQLYFRWSYVTNVNNTACEDFAGNYRIDDVQLTAAVLPVVWTGWAAADSAGRSLLTWSTAQETDTDHFAVERAGANLAFVEIGRVAAAGESREERQYRYWDATGAGGGYYYRLRQVDRDGSFQFSTVLYGPPTASPRLIFFPNPVRDQLTIRFPDGKPESFAAWEIVDAQGRKMAEGKSEQTEGELTVSTTGHRPGVYTLRVRWRDEEFTEVFVKM